MQGYIEMMICQFLKIQIDQRHVKKATATTKNTRVKECVNVSEKKNVP